MTHRDRYITIIERSEDHQAYVGSAPGLIFGGCHGLDERAVFGDLCEIAAEAIAIYHREGRPLPPATAGRDLANALNRVA